MRRGTKLSPRTFAIALADPEAFDDLRARLSPQGHGVTLVDAAEPMALVTMKGASDDTRRNWETLRGMVPDGAAVAPMMVDDRGHELMPTGRIAVRFERAPERAELERFAAEHGLRLLARNKFQAAQATFAPQSSGGVFLPTIVEDLERSPLVSAAWLETISSYSRAR